MSNEPRALRLALALVRLAGRWVPVHRRESWRLEWSAEVQAWWQAREGRTGLAMGVGLLRFAGGCVPDALVLRYGRGGMRGSLDDVRGAARGLARRPGFGAVVVATLAVGVGLTTAIFGVARDVLLRPFPYPDPGRVVAVTGQNLERPGGGNVTYPNLADLAESTSSFDGIGLARWWSPALEDDRGALVVRGATVTANFFTILGVDAGLGRFFAADEQGEGRENLVVLSRGLWVERFGADPAAIGSTIRLSGVPYRVIGVTGPEFEDPWILGGPGAQPELWRTVASPPSEWPRSGRSWRGIARVRAEVPLETAQADLSAAFAGLVEAYPEENANRDMTITPLRDLVVGPSRSVLALLLTSVALLLLIACANLANLLLGRAVQREREVGVHRALGASGGRILIRSATEVVILAAIGGAVGVVLAGLAGQVTRSFSSLLPRPVTGAVDPGIAVFALLVTAGCGLLFGIAPTLHTLRSDAFQAAGGRARGTSAGRRTQRLRRGLVVGQVALTAVLLVGSGLLTRSLLRLGDVELGLRTDGVVGLQLHGASWWDLDAPAAEALWHDVLDAARGVPGVQSVGAIDYLPLGGSYSCDGVYRTDQPRPAAGEGRCAEVRVVLPGALETLGVELVRGRRLTRQDGTDDQAVVLVDEALATSLWPDRDPIGARLQVHTREHTVVGIVRNMRHFGPEIRGEPMLYLHAPQEGWNGIARGLWLVTAGREGAPDVAALRAAVHGVRPSIAIAEPVALSTLLAQNLSRPRFRTILVLAFASTALLLALLGIAGVMLFSVARRTRELGVRLALGARPSTVRREVMGEGMRLTTLGLMLGLLVAFGLARGMDGLLFQVGARDPVVYLAVAAFMASASAAACWLPARRASSVDPVRALASE